LSFTALLANADAATFNLLRRSWFIPADNIGRIVDRTQRRRSEARPAVVTKVVGRLLQLVSREEVERQLERAAAMTRQRPSLSGSRWDPGSRLDSRFTAARAFADRRSGAVTLVTARPGRVHRPNQPMRTSTLSNWERIPAVRDAQSL
jgi:hypothetical protein